MVTGNWLKYLNISPCCCVHVKYGAMNNPLLNKPIMALVYKFLCIKPKKCTHNRTEQTIK